MIRCNFLQSLKNSAKRVQSHLKFFENFLINAKHSLEDNIFILWYSFHLQLVRPSSEFNSDRRLPCDFSFVSFYQHKPATAKFWMQLQRDGENRCNEKFLSGSVGWVILHLLNLWYRRVYGVYLHCCQQLRYSYKKQSFWVVDTGFNDSFNSNLGWNELQFRNESGRLKEINWFLKHKSQHLLFDSTN